MNPAENRKPSAPFDACAKEGNQIFFLGGGGRGGRGGSVYEQLHRVTCHKTVMDPHELRARAFTQSWQPCSEINCDVAFA